MKTGRLTVDSAAATQDIAARVGRVLQRGDILALRGDLGSGKTTFVQGLAIGLGLSPDQPIASPTYTLVSEHTGGRIPLYHFDIYRLAGPADLHAIGFGEYLDGDGVLAIEWADRAETALPRDRLDLQFLQSAGEDERVLVVTGYGERGGNLAAYLLEGNS